jgi:hypothetical protein
MQDAETVTLDLHRCLLEDQQANLKLILLRVGRPFIACSGTGRGEFARCQI